MVVPGFKIATVFKIGLCTFHKHILRALSFYMCSYGILKGLYQFSELFAIPYVHIVVKGA